MIKIAMTLAMLLPTVSLAEPRQIFKSANGQIVGRSITNNMGTTYYNAACRNTGRSTTNNTGTITFFDNMGRRIGTKESKQ
jgi:hypothetical protein